MKFSIITCSDTRAIEEDEAGAALTKMIEDQGWEVAEHIVVPDERQTIANHILKAIEDEKVDFVLTCGGTGPSLRDVTPEATKDVCERDVPGIAEFMRAESQKKVVSAMLSRGVCMQKDATIVINLPGSTRGATENFEVIIPVLPHAVKMMQGAHHN